MEFLCDSFYVLFCHAKFHVHMTIVVVTKLDVWVPIVALKNLMCFPIVIVITKFDEHVWHSCILQAR